jgi:hypothetical protein
LRRAIANHPIGLLLIFQGGPHTGIGTRVTVATLYFAAAGVIPMPRSPSIVPHGVDHDIYLVLNDFGKQGRAWCETDEEGTDRETLIRRLLEDQYSHPVRIVAFNTAEGRSRDVPSTSATSCAVASLNMTRCHALCRRS